MEIRFDQTRVPSAFSVLLQNGETVTVEGADAYEPEGPMTTFFAMGTSRRSIDAWSVRVASYRTVDIVAINRIGRVPRDERSVLATAA